MSYDVDVQCRMYMYYYIQHMNDAKWNGKCNYMKFDWNDILNMWNRSKSEKVRMQVILVFFPYFSFSALDKLDYFFFNFLFHMETIIF